MTKQAIQKEFNPFNILPRALMLELMLDTFSDDANTTLEIFLDYNKVSKGLRKALSHQKNFQYILDSMPIEFNMAIYPTLKKRITKTEEGRYRAAAALLFLKHLYSHLKPFPNDDFLVEHFNQYHESFSYIMKTFNDSPMTMYISAYVTFFIAKRVFFLNPLDKELNNMALQIYKIASHCIARAHELEHPLAKIFRADMQLQLQRHNVTISEKALQDLPTTPEFTFHELIELLVDNIPINPNLFSEETQTLLMVTWQKLIIENYYAAKEMFNYTYRNEKLLQITEFYYNCYQKNQFHRHILAHNPLFTMVDKKENILYLLQAFNVDALVTMFQGFRVYSPKPDSVLLSSMIRMSIDELKDFRELASNFLALPQTGMQPWKVYFNNSYRDACEDGSMQSISSKQMTMTLKYFELLSHARKLPEILDRDADILQSVFHCKNEQIHDIAIAVINQLVAFNVLHPLGQLHQQDLLLKLLYKDGIYLSLLKIKSQRDLDRIATIINETYAEKIAPELLGQPDIKVFDYMYDNNTKLRDTLHEIHDRFTEYGYLKAA